MTSRTVRFHQAAGFESCSGLQARQFAFTGHRRTHDVAGFWPRLRFQKLPEGYPGLGGYERRRFCVSRWGKIRRRLLARGDHIKSNTTLRRTVIGGVQEFESTGVADPFELALDQPKDSPGDSIA